MKESAQAQKALGIILPVLLALLIFILWQSQVIHAILRTDVFTLPLPTRIAAIIHDNWSAMLVNIKSTVMAVWISRHVWFWEYLFIILIIK
mgnify:CR=1 FL=1